MLITMKVMTKKYIYIALIFNILLSFTWASISGNIAYEKRYYSDVSPTGIEADIYVPLGEVDISLFVDGASTATESTTTATDGSFTFSTTTSSSYSITIYAKNSHIEVGTSTSSGSAENIYSKTITGITGSDFLELTVSIDENSGAFNILSLLEQGWDWFNARNLTLTEVLSVQWPGNGTYFEPDDFSLSFLGVTNSNSDPDEFDDDVILHEFGHAAAEAFSTDHSLGGSHSITSKGDLRLAWSEGLATYIGTAIKGDTNYRDSNGSVSSSGITSYGLDYDIANPVTLATHSTNEWAVSYILYQAEEASGVQEVIDTITSFQNNSTKLASEQATLDAFHDLWTGSNIATSYEDRSMSYNVDSLEGLNTEDNPTTITGDLTKLTFYPSSGADYFKHSGVVGDVLTISTSNPTNGVLTKIEIYKENGSSLELQTSNSQANGLSSDSISALTYTLDETANHIIKVSRFNSTSQNFGLGSSNGYSKTAGIYGGYDLNFSYVRTNTEPDLTLDTLDDSSTDNQISDVFEDTIDSYNSVNLTSKIKSFGNILTSAGHKTFTYADSVNGNSVLSIVNSNSSSTDYTISDDTLPLTVSGIPSGVTAVISILPVSKETNIHDLNRGKFFTIDYLNGSEVYSSNVDLSVTFTSGHLSNRVHQLMKQSSEDFIIENDYLNSISGDSINTTITSSGVYSLRQLVNSNASTSDQQAQLTSFITNNSDLDDLHSELAYFQHLVDNNGDTTLLETNGSSIYVVKSNSDSGLFSDELSAEGNVTLSGVDEDLTLVFSSLPNSTSSNLPDNAEDQIYSINLISSGLSIDTGFTVNALLNDEGRSDFDYFLYRYNGSSNTYSHQNNIASNNPGLTLSFPNDGFYSYSANVDVAASDNNTVTYIVEDLLEDSTTINDTVDSSQLSEFIVNFISIVIETGSDHSTSTVASIKKVTSANQIITHDDDVTPLSIASVAQGNSLLILTIPSSEEVNYPSNGVGKVISIDLYDGETEITTGFSIPITIEGVSNSNYKLYVQDPSTGSFSDSGFASTISGGNTTFTATHFSVFTLADETPSSSSGGGGGGGCLLK